MFRQDSLEFNPKGQNLIDQQLTASGIENFGLFDFVTDIFTGGASTQNKQARKQASRQNKYNKKVYKFEGKELKRQYKYAKKGQKIKKRNLERDLLYQEETERQQWNYGMAIRDYEYKRDLDNHYQSVVQANQQKNFNEVSERFAYLQQDRNLMEQQIELGLQEQENYLNYTAQAYGLQLQKKKLQSGAASAMRQSNIAALKAKGQAASRGQAGRTTGKSLNAIQMEAHAAENDIVNELMTDMSQVDMDVLFARQQNLQDKIAIDLSRNNLVAADRLSRQQITLQRAQADMDAQASILAKPSLAPPLPTPLTLPRPEFQKIYKPKQGPEPMKEVPFQANLGGAFFRNSLNIAMSVASFGQGG